MAFCMKIFQSTAQSSSRSSFVHRCALLSRSSHSKSNSDDPDQSSRLPRVGMSADGRTLIGWHPEPEHPYEHTKPVQYDMKEMEKGNILKDEVVHDYLTRYRPEGPTVPELAALTYTTKHQWFPKPEKKYKKKIQLIDRDSI